MGKWKCISKIKELQNQEDINDFCKGFLNQLKQLEDEFDADGEVEHIQGIDKAYIDQSSYAIKFDCHTDHIIIFQTLPNDGDTIEEWFSMDMVEAYVECRLREFVQGIEFKERSAKIADALSHATYYLSLAQRMKGYHVFDPIEYRDSWMMMNCIQEDFHKLLMKFIL